MFGDYGLYTIVSVNGVAVNKDRGMLVVVERTQAGAMRRQQRTRDRLGRAPDRLQSVQQSRQMRFRVSLNALAHSSQSLELNEYNALVAELFWDEAGLMPVVVHVPPDNPLDDPIELRVDAEVVSLEPDGFDWVGTWEIPDPVWYEVGSGATVTASPVEVGGNRSTYATLTVTSDVSGTRHRVMLRDRTGQGMSGWFASIPWSAAAANTRVWINGLEMPFRVDGGRLWFRVDMNAKSIAIVDCYESEGISNTTTANRLETEGTVLNEGLVAGTSLVASVSQAMRRSAGSMYTWHPDRTAAHERNMSYTFGLTDDAAVTIRERDGTGSKTLLDDDADSFVLTSSCELQQLSGLTVEVAAGYLPAARDDSASGSGDNTSQRVRTMSAKTGPVHMRVVFTNTNNSQPERLFKVVGTSPNKKLESLFRLRFLGAVLSPATVSWGTVNPDGTITFFPSAFGMDADFVDRLFGSNAVLSGTYPVYTVSFPQGAFAGEPIPLVQVATNELIPGTGIEAYWVDASGNPILEVGRGGTGTGNRQDPNSPTIGSVKAVVRYRVRDDPNWITAWQKVVVGSPTTVTTTTGSPLYSRLSRLFPDMRISPLKTVTETFEPEPVTLVVPTLNIPGAVQVAVGLEPAGDNINTVTWGTVKVLTDPTLTFGPGKAPIVSVFGPIDASVLSGTVRNDTNGDWIRLTEVLCDDGLLIDTDREDMIGLGVDVWYGKAEVRRPDGWFRLQPGENDWVVVGDMDVSLSYVQRRQL